MDGIIVGIETSGKLTKMGYQEGNKFVEFSFGAYHMHSEYLIMLWKKLENKIKDKNIKFIAISKGPGYFTSLRAGFSFAKALWFARRVPFVGVNTLDALAYPLLKEERNVIAFLEIKKDKVFWKEFSEGKEVEFKMGKVEDIPIKKDFVYVGKSLEIEEKVKRSYPLEAPSIYSLIEIGKSVFEKSEFLDMEKAEPFYFYTPSYVKSFPQKS